MQVITVVPGNRVYLHTGSPCSVVTVGSVTAIVVLEAMPCPRGRVQRAVPSCKSWVLCEVIGPTYHEGLSRALVAVGSSDDTVVLVTTIHHQ